MIKQIRNKHLLIINSSLSRFWLVNTKFVCLLTSVNTRLSKSAKKPIQKMILETKRKLMY